MLKNRQQRAPFGLKTPTLQWKVWCDEQLQSTIYPSRICFHQLILRLSHPQTDQLHRSLFASLKPRRPFLLDHLKHLCISDTQPCTDISAVSGSIKLQHLFLSSSEFSIREHQNASLWTHMMSPEGQRSAEFSCFLCGWVGFYCLISTLTLGQLGLIMAPQSSKLGKKSVFSSNSCS